MGNTLTPKLDAVITARGQIKGLNTVSALAEELLSRIERHPAIPELLSLKDKMEYAIRFGCTDFSALMNEVLFLAASASNKIEGGA